MSDNQSNNKRIAKNTGVLYIRQLLTLGLSLYTSRLTLQVLGEEDFGIYATVAGFTALLSTLTTSLASGTQRFITFELGRGDFDKLNKVYCTAINIHVLLSVLLIIIGESVGCWFIFNKMTVPPDRLMVAFWVFQLTLLNTVLMLVNTPNNAEIVAHEDMGAWALVSIIDAILRCVSVILLFFISWDKLLIYAVFLFLIQFLNRTICIVWCKRKYSEVNYHFIWDKSLMKSMLSITGWTGLNNLAVTGFIQGVNLLLNVFFGPVLNAAYTVAMQAYSGIRQFCSSFQLASNPQIVKLYSTGDLEEMRKLLYTVCKLSFFLIFVLSLPFVVNADYILTLWLGKVPEHSVSFFILLLIYAYTDVFAYPLDIAAQATGNMKKYSLVISTCVLSTLPIAYLLYIFGAIPETIYYVAIIVSWVGLMLRIICLKRLVGISLRTFVSSVLFRSVCVALFSAVPAIVATCFVDKGFIEFCLVSLLTLLWTVTMVYVFGLSKIEKKMVVSTFSKIKSKLHG